MIKYLEIRLAKFILSYEMKMRFLGPKISALWFNTICLNTKLTRDRVVIIFFTT